MDLQTFLNKMQASLGEYLNCFEIKIIKNNLPQSIQFVVLSEEFETTDRGNRIMFMAAMAEKTFGLPLTFSPAGCALTFEEAKKLEVI
jgi:hypothetical protein